MRHCSHSKILSEASHFDLVRSLRSVLLRSVTREQRDSLKNRKLGATYRMNYSQGAMIALLYSPPHKFPANVLATKNPDHQVLFENASTLLLRNTIFSCFCIPAPGSLTQLPSPTSPYNLFCDIIKIQCLE